MIQITKWIDIKERVWCKKGLIPIFEWLSNEKDNLELLTHKKFIDSNFNVSWLDNEKII